MEQPAIAIDATGDTVVTWQGRQEEFPGGDGYETTRVVAQRLSPGGAKIGDAIAFPLGTGTRAHSAAVASDDDGDFVITVLQDVKILAGLFAGP